jgi:hypothetical protein
MEDKIYYFEEDKPENTDTALDLVKRALVVASTRGFSGLKAVEALRFWIKSRCGDPSDRSSGS